MSKKRFLDTDGIRQLLGEGAPPEGKTRTVFDSEDSRFAARVSPKGMVTFCMVYSFGGQVKRFTIGRWAESDGRGFISADTARATAKTLNQKIDAGIDIASAEVFSPHVRRKSKREKEPPPWIRLSKEDLEASSQMFAVEFAEKLYPKLLRCYSTEEHLAAIREAFIETVEAA